MQIFKLLKILSIIFERQVELILRKNIAYGILYKSSIGLELGFSEGPAHVKDIFV